MTRENTAQNRTSPTPSAGAQQLTEAWLRASSHFANSVVEANRATLAALGFNNRNGNGHARSDPNVESVAYDDPDWTGTRTVENADDIQIGDTVTFSKTISDEDVHAFAEASGDTNRLHLDDAFATETRFSGRIAHGTLVSGLISAALARLPGVTVYLSQNMRFLNPVRIGSRLTATVEVTEALATDRFRLSTSVTNEDDETVIEGEAVVLVDPEPEARERASGRHETRREDQNTRDRN
ncbi:enoyl-CoA hydratase [Haloferax mucosum ATCC BAA-1512]|uniref:Enoyl-CoA hydratase n=1 Tax=Haloferax mucosum ATCC BAA-1512 TaxID=662479 RepID=M0IGA5_9EURY|nr:MaoC family dehydratase [Haloferax mucosum]ELZ94474.1 enoyl-CoA hydratase [Haloferax mucosum ATCC BAA-1512]